MTTITKTIKHSQNCFFYTLNTLFLMSISHFYNLSQLIILDFKKKILFIIIFIRFSDILKFLF